MRARYVFLHTLHDARFVLHKDAGKGCMRKIRKFQKPIKRQHFIKILLNKLMIYDISHCGIITRGTMRILIFLEGA